MLPVQVQKAVLFIDNDPTGTGLYTYRRPHLAAAKKRGFARIVALPPGHEISSELREDSDLIIKLDTLGSAEIIQEVNLLADQYKFEAVLCHAGHPSPRGLIGIIVAEVAQAIGLRYCKGEAIEAANNKFLCRQAIENTRLNNVSFFYANSAAEVDEGIDAVGLPLIFKPPYGASCSFVKRCTTKEQVHSQHQRFVSDFGKWGAKTEFGGHLHNFVGRDEQVYQHIPGHSVLLEAFIDGPEGSVECAVIGDKVIPMIVHDKLVMSEGVGTIYEHFLVTPPSRFTQEEVLAIKIYAEEIIGAIGLTDCLVHLEFRLDQQRNPQIIEVNPRLGGMYIDAAFQSIFDYDPYDLYLSILLGEVDVDEVISRVDRAHLASEYYAMFALYPPKTGVFAGVEGLAKASAMAGVLRHKVAYDTGVYMNCDEAEYFLIKFWCVGQSPQVLLDLYETISRTVTIYME